MTDLSAGKSLHQPGGSPPDGPELEPGALRHGGEERRWLLHRPAALPPGPRPMVLMFHGAGATAAMAARQTGWGAVADREGLLVAFPEGTAPDPAAPPRFCQHCASSLVSRFLEEEGRTRLVCSSCGFVHYLNPKLVANVLPESGGRVLLLRRGIEPSYGKWAFPGGYLELGESAEEGAEREALEEVGMQVRAGPLLGVYTRVQHGVVAYTGV